MYEGGESVRFDQHAIEEGIDGTLRLMKHLNMITQAPEPKEEKQDHLELDMDPCKERRIVSANNSSEANSSS